MGLSGARNKNDISMVQLALFAICAFAPCVYVDSFYRILEFMCIVATLIVIFKRVRDGQAILPIQLLTEPVVLAVVGIWVLGTTPAIFFSDTLGIQPIALAPEFGLFSRTVFEHFVGMLLPIYLFAAGPTTPKDLKKCLILFACSAFLMCIVRLFRNREVEVVMMLTPHSRIDNPKAGCIQAACAVVIFASLLLTSSLKKPLSLSVIFMAVTNLVFLTIVSARGSFLGVTVALPVLLLAHRIKTKRVFALYLGALLVLTLLFVGLHEGGPSGNGALGWGPHSTAWGRIIQFQSMIEFLRMYPFGGLGFTVWNSYVCGPVNMFLEAWITFGILGMFLAFFIMGWTLWSSLCNTRLRPRISDVSFVNSSGLAIVVVLVLGFSEDTFWCNDLATNFPVFLAIGMLVFVKRWLMRNGLQQEKQEASI